MSYSCTFGRIISLVLFLVFAPYFRLEAGTALTDAEGIPIDESASEVVVYPAVFFEQYRPITARDMVQRVPGFRIDDGGGRRGFGGVAGNVLINGERPSTKDDTVSALLERIPASQVERIDLIRGRSGGLDLGGQSVVVNVVLKTEGAAAYKWETKVEQDVDGGGPTPEGSLSVSDSFGRTQYNAGIDAERFLFNARGPEDLLVGGAVAEDRDEKTRGDGVNLSASFNSESKLGETLLHVNGKLSYNDFDRLERSRRTPRDPGLGGSEVEEASGNNGVTIEVGGDVEHPLAETLTGKLILLYNRTGTDGFSSRRALNDSRLQTSFSRADFDATSSEAVARTEFDWTRFADHHIELNLEGAYNALDNALVLKVDNGNGLETVPLPGANTRVEELRGDFALIDSWTIGSWVVEGTLGAETSTISQSGDAEKKRDFFFTKPRLALTYAPSTRRQLRVSMTRDVAQLDFNDFVSSTNFADQQFSFGNPDLRPERTWMFEASFEQRFGEIGVITLTGFHDWIDDVQDHLALGGIFEIPGNIGNGRRWGGKLEATLPLDAVALAGGRLDIEGRWQGSRVIDPVTGRPRVLSNEEKRKVTLDFRQDFDVARVAWGWTIELRGRTPQFGLDEFVVRDDRFDMDAFVETTRWFGIKIRLLLENVANRRISRDRTVFAGPRDLSPIAFEESRNRLRGRSVILTLSGSF
ncbi:MAG: TonB-dependent receptor [Alphaproteobacteria bacterium]|nr:MAG: TonB-dependent receptor [Alphaproteobacteria bacterium]